MSVNKVILVGNLGKDPELRYTSSGKAVCNFTVATSERYKDQDGEAQEKTEWHSIVVWEKLAEICGKYLEKGKQIYREGKLQTRKWQDRDGNDRYTTEVVCYSMQMLGRKDDNDRPEPRSQQSEQRPASQTAPSQRQQREQYEAPQDDIPF